MPVSIPPGAPQSVDGRETLLLDRQTRVGTSTEVHYVRGAVRPTAAAGLAAASTVRVEYDASYQSLAWHTLLLHRDGHVVDVLGAADVRIATAHDQPQLVLDRTTATLFIPDVRVGDVIEYGYSLTGSQPALRGRFDAAFMLARDVPVGRLEHRLSWPVARPMSIKVHESGPQPAIANQGAYAMYIWQRDNVPARKANPIAPQRFVGAPWVEVSEFDSWREVVTWARPLYAPIARDTSAVRTRAQAWQRELGTAAAVERVIRFVQEEVRYLGFELGEGSYVPHPPDVVAARRFGDCKDKALLLVEMLRAIGIDAAPALVNTDELEHVRDRLPSAGAFNHVIAVARIDGETHWIDGTTSYERGALKARPAPDFGVALVLAPGVTDLQDMPRESSSEPSELVRESIQLNLDGSASLRVVTRYRNREAQAMRARIAMDSAKEFERKYHAFYAKLYGELIADKAIEMRDDEANDALEILESYTLPHVWEHDKFALSAWKVQNLLPTPDAGEHDAPIELGRGTFFRHEISVEVPERFEIAPVTRDVITPWFEYRYRVAYQHPHLTLSYEYRGLVNEIPADAVTEYAARAHELPGANGFELTWVPRHGRFVPFEQVVREPRESDGPDFWITLVFVLAMIGLPLYFLYFALRALAGRLRTAQRKYRFFSRLRSRKGETPKRPLSIRSLDEVDRHMDGMRCDCSGRPAMAMVRKPARAHYMGQMVWHQTAVCAACNAKETRYFHVAGEAAAQHTHVA